MDDQFSHRLEYPINIGVDAAVDRVLRMAAWIGALSSDETFCSFTSILLSLLYIDHDSGEFAQRTGVDIAAIRAHRRIDEDGIEEARRRATTDDLPQGKPMYSVSAQNILQAAADAAQESGSTLVGARHLFLAYIFRTPQAHRDQMRAWRFDPAAVPQEEQDRAGKPEPAKDTLPPKRVPGTTLLGYQFSHAALLVLRTAVNIAGPRRPSRNFIGSGTLLKGLATVRIPNSEEHADSALLNELLPPSSAESEAAFAAAGTGEPFRTGEVLPELSPNLNEILVLAAQIARRTRPDRTALIGLRHLFAGLLKHEDTPPTNAHKRLVAAGNDIIECRRKLADHIAANWTADDIGAWRSYLLPDPRAAVLVSSFDSDNPLAQSRDFLDVADEAKAFARLMASSQINPPLSIGIFGDWGAGKTFFMDRMYEHVEEIARIHGADVESTMFCRGIVQIRFNAWHYIETNLWASLVEFVFDELDRWLRPSGETERIEALFDQLATSRQLKLEALQELVFTRQQREAAKNRLEKARTDYEAALVRRQSASPRAFWSAVAATFTGQFAGTAEGQAAERALDQASERLGLPRMREAGGELLAALKEADTQAGRARIIGRGLLQTVGGKWWWLTAGLALLFMPVALMALTKWLGHIQSLAWFGEIGSTSVGISSVLAIIAGYVGWGARQARGALDTLERFRDQLDKAISDETTQPREDFAKAEREVAVSQAAVTEAEQQFSQAEQRVREARRDLESGTACGRLNRFIRDKVVAGDYAKHLGIIATIRKDFDQLSRIMDAAADRRQLDEGERLEKEHQDRVKAFIKQHEKYLDEDDVKALRDKKDEKDLRLFRRIILYIDDLDRCPPAKVIEVLQAIHLLLYFNLFVVVVAVDSRWISRALTKSYPGLLDEGPGLTRHRAESASASAHDYLEKIFQIPYWVRPMDGPDSEKFVAALLGDERPQAPPQPAPSSTVPVPENPSPAEDPLIPPRQPEAPASETPPQVPEPEAAVVDPRLETLSLSNWETGLMRRLAPCLGQSPRRAKRFVNVYRLVKTGLPQPLLETLVDPEGKSCGYRALLTQLAIVTGAPATAPVYFAVLTSGFGQGETLEALNRRLAQDQQLVDLADGHVIQGALATLLAFSQERSADISEVMVEQLRLMAPIASRYSFLRRR